MKLLIQFYIIFFICLNGFSQSPNAGSENRATRIQSDMTSDLVIRELDSSITRYTIDNPVEKVYLHTDRDLFTSGDKLWYKAYVVLGENHQFSMDSQVLHVDLIGPKNQLLVSQTHQLIDGKTTGSIALPKDLYTGNYQLRAYTNWMRNYDADFFFTKTLKVVGPSEVPAPLQHSGDAIDLQFFPEGGHAVAGLMGQIAFKAIKSDGYDRKIKGYIQDSKGIPVVHLGTITRGSGFFYLQPKFGESYTAILDDGSEFPLPKIMDQGYAMTINNTVNNSIKIKLQATEALRKEPFYIIGHINNKKYYQGKFDFRNKKSITIELLKEGIPSGVMAFTLFDQDKKPWCERVVFINNQEGLVIDVKIAPDNISKRNEVAVDVNVADANGKPVSTELSLSITDSGQVVKNPNSGNILTHLLLQSDIKGHIQDPGLLFKDQSRLTLYAIDLVMLTHGWRKFPWREIQESSSTPKKFPILKGRTISGTARGLYDNTLKRMDLTAIAKSGENYGMFTVKTSDEGKFSIPDFNFIDSTKVIFSAYNKKNKQLNLKIVLDSDKTTPPIPQFNNPSPKNKEKEENEEYHTNYSKRRALSSFYEDENTIALQEVEVRKRVVKTTSSKASTLGQTPDKVLFTEGIKSTSITLVDLVSRFVGVTVMGSFPNYAVSIRQGGTPLWVLNGVPISKGGPQATGMLGSVISAPVPSQIATMDISNVERVELIRGPSAVMWGSRGANGVFLVYTKLGGGKEYILAPEFDIMGHAIAREFYSPNYSVPLDRHSFQDYRTTLYWNPSFRTDENGKARLFFYNSDHASQLQVDVEGLSDGGKLGAYLKTFGESEDKL